MNLLKEGMEQKAVIKTAMTRKLTVDGLTKAYPVYKVKLDWLFYNDQNDRREKRLIQPIGKHITTSLRNSSLPATRTPSAKPR